MQDSSNHVDSPDGLPVIQPTRERVDEFLEYTDRDPNHVVGKIPPANAEATIEKVASNAVLAGCEPQYLPIILTAVEAMTREEFNLSALLNTTHPTWPIIMVNGPLVEELEINYGFNALGQGFPANATIGRAITMVCMNIGGAIPAQADNATLGGPHKFGMCFAENKGENPWEPFHVSHGFEEETTTVTVVNGESPHNIEDHVARTAPKLLTTIAHSMATLGTNLMYFNSRGEPFLILCPEHANLLHQEGWTKLDIKRFLYDQARVPQHLKSDKGLDYDYDDENSSPPWPKHFDVGDPHQRVGIAPSPEHFKIVVVGGPGRHSSFLPSWGDTNLQTAPVTHKGGSPVNSTEEFRDS